MSRFVVLTLVCSVALVAAQYTPETPNACAATSCLVGSVCVEEGGVGRCVAPSGSKTNCSLPFEEWKQCATCEATCDNKTPICNRMCQPARCMCRKGYFRNNAGRCVTANDCDVAATTPTPSICKRENEEYRECASACEPSCRNKDQEMMCIAMCNPAPCQCKAGFFRAENGDCVSASQCPSRDPSVTPPPSTPQCKKNEAFSSCSSMCEPQCGQYKPIACIMMCGPPKCQCTSGFYRSSNGDCVTRAACDKQTSSPKTPRDCKINEKFNECSSMCEEKCGEALTACPASCGPPKCQCNVGFVRNSVGDCVSRSGCETGASITCANIRCAGKCRDTPTGPICGPRPLILPISVGPTSTPGI